MGVDFLGNPNRPLYDETDDLDSYSDYDVSEVYDFMGTFESSDYDSTGDEDYDPYEDYILESGSSISSSSEVPGPPNGLDDDYMNIADEDEETPQKPETFPTSTEHTETNTEESTESVAEENANS